MRKMLCMLSVILLFTGFCFAMGFPAPELSAEEKAFLEKIEVDPKEIIVTSEEVEDAWGRAQSWVGGYSSMKIQTVTDYIIETYNPHSSGSVVVYYGYSIVKKKLENGDFVIKVDCTSDPEIYGKHYAERNAKILAHYIKTGENYPKLISK